MSQTPTRYPSPVLFGARGEKKPPGVAILVNTEKSLVAPTLWKRWLEDGRQWGVDVGVETASATTKGQHESALLRFYIQLPGYFHETAAKQLVDDDVCRKVIHSQHNCLIQKGECLRTLLTAAFEDFPEAEWFLIIRGDSVPVKKFSFIYQSLLRDTRSRITWYDEKSASQYMLLRKDHAEALRAVEDVDALFEASSAWRLNISPLMQAIGSSFLTDTHPNYISLPKELWPTKGSGFMFDPYLERPDRDGAPIVNNISREILETVIGDPIIWFYPSIGRHAVVAACPSSAVEKYEPAVPIDWKDMKFPKFVVGSDVRGRGKLWRAVGQPEAPKVFPPKETCRVEDYLTWRFMLSSLAKSTVPAGAPIYPPKLEAQLDQLSVEEAAELLDKDGLWGRAVDSPPPPDDVKEDYGF